MLKTLIAAVILLLCAGCQLTKTYVKPPLVNEGEVLLYLEPFSQQDKALRFNLKSVSALRNDGVEVPLALRLVEVSAKSASRQRLVATGVLPAGSYRGFSFGTERAILSTDKGEVTLGVALKPERQDFPFEVKRGRGVVISLALRVGESVHESSFRPAFSFFFPQRPLPPLTGYVTNFGSNNITVFDKKAGSVRDVIETGPGPKGIVLDRRLYRAYVAVSGEDAILIVDMLTNEVINRIKLTYGDRPGELLLTPDGNTLICANTGSNTVSFLDPNTLLELRRVNVGKQPVALIFAPSYRKVYVFDNLSNDISVIDVDSRSVTATIPTEPAPLRGAFNRRGDQLTVFFGWSPYMLVLDSTSFATLRRVNVGMGVSFIKVDSATDLTYVGKRHEDRVAIYAPFTLFPSDFPVDQLRGTGGAGYMLIDSDENNILLVLPEQKALQTVNLISKQEVSLIDLGDEPFRAAIVSER
jgi:YVTN family beta-propeller protein